MEQLNRKDIKEIFEDAITPLIVELKANKDSHDKEIERLTKQSTEHYANFKILEDNMQKQVRQCQIQTGESGEKSGLRMGNLEQRVTVIDEHVKTNTKTIDDHIESNIKAFEDIANNKKFNITQWLVVAGVVAMIILGVLPYFGG